MHARYAKCQRCGELGMLVFGTGKPRLCFECRGRLERKCKDCGVDISDRPSATKRCPECAAASKRATNRAWMSRKRYKKRGAPLIYCCDTQVEDVDDETIAFIEGLRK